MAHTGALSIVVCRLGTGLVIGPLSLSVVICVATCLAPNLHKKQRLIGIGVVFISLNVPDDYYMLE